MAQRVGLAQPTSQLDRVPQCLVRLEARVVHFRAKSAVDIPMPPRVVVLANVDGSLGAATMLLEVPGISITEVRTAKELVQLVRGGGIAAAVLDPELGGGWPVDTAEQVVNGIQDLVPLILVCRCTADAVLLASRTSRSGATVLRAEALTWVRLDAVVKGTVAAHDARPTPRAPS